ncbi:MAG: ABC transporter permease [Beijerinckiaceae bacterium]|nr:ABC transporter permease [Beijerinckiaceae bacterium]
MPGAFSLSLRLALREMRGGLRGFGVFIACIALGVAAIVSVGSLARGLTEGLASQGRAIIGGDAAFTTLYRELSDAERRWFEARGTLSRVGLMRAMSRNEAGTPALVEIKAVGKDYPREGTIDYETPSGGAGRPLADLLGESDGVHGALADPLLFTRLDAKPGDIIILGNLKLRLMAAIKSEPDKLSGGIGFGPRLLISEQALMASGLVQPGSLLRWNYRLILPPAAAGDAALDAFVADAAKAFPEGGWEVRTRRNANPQFAKNLERFAQFLTLVGFTALIVGGVGVANATRAFVERKRLSIATLKSLGASGRFVVGVYLWQVLMLAGLGIFIGLAAGAALPFFLVNVLGDLLPFPLVPALYFDQLGLGVLYGVLTALAFSLWPLGAAHDIPVSALFRGAFDDKARWPRGVYLVLVLAAVLALGAVSIFFAFDRRVALIYIGASVATFVLLRVVGSLIMRLAARLPHPRLTELRLALSNIHKPGALTPSVVLSLGLGVSLLVSLTLIDGNIRTQLTRNLPEKAPNFFFIDIQNADAANFERFLKERAPSAALTETPMMRGRMIALKGVNVSEIKADEKFSWVLDGDRGITYAQKPPENTKITDGQWWPADYAGEPLVSFDNEIAEGLGLKVGDTVTVNVLGRNLTARIANLRKVEWQSLGINFVMVFSPNTFAGAPHTLLASLTFADKNDAAAELSLLKAVANAFPSITSVRVKDTLSAINDLVGQLADAIRGASAVALVASILVLAGALAAGQESRIYDAVVLKTLGATRPRLLLAFGLEYALLGASTALFGFVAGLGSAYVIVTQVMKLEFFMLWSAALLAMMVALIVTISLGLSGTFRVLGAKPALYLRNL